MTAQLPSKIRLAQIASFTKSMALPPSHDEIEALALFALAAYEQEPVMEIRSHFNGEYVCRKMTKGTLKPGVMLYTHPAPSIPAPQGDFDFERYNDIVWLDAVASQPAVHGVTAATVATLAIELNRRLDAAVLSIPAVPENPPFAVMQRALDAFYAESDEVPENQMLAAYRVFHSAMLNGGKS